MSRFCLALPSCLATRRQNIRQEHFWQAIGAYHKTTMSTASLDSLLPEILKTIIDQIESEIDSDRFETPTEGLLSLRLTCKALEQACHKSISLYFSDWSIDLEKEKDLSKTKAVLASPAHKAAIEKITFVYRGTKPNLCRLHLCSMKFSIF